MRLSIFIGLCLGLVFAQDARLELVDEVFFPGVYHASGDTTGTSDVWGWISPSGEEYVLAGVKDGTAIIRASDMRHLFTVPGPTLNDYFYHRDIKTYRNYAYVSAEMRGTNEGIQVIDLSGLPDSVTLVKTLTDRIITSHNLTVDTVSETAYITGSTFEGVYVYDLFRPHDPIPLAYLPETNVHDVFARNDTLWVANSHDYSIWDVKLIGNPALIARLSDTSFGYCHNIWPTKDGRHFVTTEETIGRTVKIWSLSNRGTISLVSEFLAASDLVHNAHVEGDLLYLAHYSSGVVVVDIADPANPQAIAQYDSYPLNDTSAFYGCWGVYPHSPSGYVYASNFEGKVQKLRLSGTSSLGAQTKSLPVLLFPNPGTSPSVDFSLHHASKVSISWTDAQGRVVASETKVVSPGKHRLAVSAESWPAGMYFFFLETGEGSAGGAWVKQ
jgi:choice-of-anchor B domain-containing protein